MIQALIYKRKILHSKHTASTLQILIIVFYNTLFLSIICV